jgi:hypothetical protein
MTHILESITVNASPQQIWDYVQEFRRRALYFSFALMNWTAKDSASGGIYARPVSLGNFAHFFSGTLIPAKYMQSSEFNLSILLARFSCHGY